MADNTQLGASSPTGAIAATDEIGGVHYQRMKVGFGDDGSYTDASLTNPVPVRFSGATPISASGTITTGGTAQNAAAANTSRRGFWIQNNSTGDLWISTIATAVQSQPSLKIPAGALYESPLGGAGTGAISIIGATTSQAFSGREW